MTSSTDKPDPEFQAEGDSGEVKKPSIDDLPENILIAEAEQSLDDAEHEDAEALRKRYLLQRFWHTAKGFWSPHRGDRLAWLLTFSLLVLILANLAALYGINLWNRAIFDALEKRDAPKVLYLAGVFLPLAVASVLFGMTNVWARMTTQRRWRAWVSDAVISRWLKNGRYYQLNRL
jgi:putative ATP-binding cassette transporter